MKIKSNWSMMGYLVGGAFSLLSAIRYFVMWPDMDKAIVYITIGGLICCVSWLYGQNLEKGNKLAALQERQAEIEDLLKEKEIIKETLIEAQ